MLLLSLLVWELGIFMDNSMALLSFAKFSKGGCLLATFSNSLGNVGLAELRPKFSDLLLTFIWLNSFGETPEFEAGILGLYIYSQ